MTITQEFGPYSYTQLPPDSTGKKLATQILQLVEFVGATKTFLIGDEVNGETSGAITTIVRTDQTGANGQIAVVFASNSPVNVFTSGENLQVDGTTYATYQAKATWHSPAQVIAGGNNPLSKMFVGTKGSAYVRFSEGEQQMDAAGMSRNSTPTQLRQYTHQYGIHPECTAFLDGSATVTHLPNEVSLALDVDTTNGDKSMYTTNMWHPHQVGFGQLAEMTVVCGDSGKTNVVRRWGYFDDDDGVFFELDGTSMYVVIRSSCDGTSNDIRVAQDDWNRDKLDGSTGVHNLSGWDLALTELNLYWIDFLWLGAGKIRYGVYDNHGDRVTAHIIDPTDPYPFMKQASLPLRAEIFNTSTTVSPSRLKVSTMTVMTEGRLVPARERLTDKWSKGQGSSKVVGGSYEPLISFRSAQTINSITNRKVSIPELLSVYVKGQPCQLLLAKGGTLTTPNWTSAGAGTAGEYDLDATDSTNEEEIVSWMFETGCHNDHFPSNFGLFSENMHLGADASADEIYTFLARSLEGSDSTVRMNVTWIDVG